MFKLTFWVVAVLPFVTGLVYGQQVSLKNGDRLTGSIVSIDTKKLVIKTAYAGEVSIDREAVDKFESDQALVVTKTGQKTVTGSVSAEDGTYVVTTAQGSETVGKNEVVAVRSPADQVTYEKSLHPGILEGWAGGSNLGLSFARGNSETTNVALGFDAARKTPGDAWVINAASIYSTDENLGAITANSFQGSIRYDHDLSRSWFAYGTFAGGYDDLQDLNYRLMPSGGVGFHAIASPKTTLDLLGGLGYTRESFTTGLRNNLLSLSVGDEFGYKLGPRTTIMQNLYYVLSLNDTGNYRIIGNLGITTKLNGWMTTNLLFNDRYYSQPVLGKKNNDILFTTGLGITFGARPKR
jgi:hypothetical protein